MLSMTLPLCCCSLAGQTRKAAGPRSEAEGYWLVAEAAAWWGSHQVRERAFTEVNIPCSFTSRANTQQRFRPE